MKKIFTFLLFSIICLNAKEYYSKLEPFESFSVKSAVSGKVVYVNSNLEGNYAKDSLIVKIDSALNEIELEESRKKLAYLDEMIKIEEENFERLNKISSKSAFEKDSQKLKVINYKSQRADLIIKIETLKDIIKNKKLIEKSNYIFNISVKVGDYVNGGTMLYETKDLSKGKLEIFVPINDIEEIKNKDIYIDGLKSDIKINKIYEVADSVNISSYKVELLLENVENFSRLVKIEFK